MWIFTVDGLVMPASVTSGADKRLTRGCRLNLQVRARDKEQLARFRRRFFHKKFCDNKGQAQVSAIQMTPTFDYQYRFYTTRAVFSLVLADAVMEIDYPKFKPAAGLVGGRAYESALNRVWDSLARDYGAWGREGALARRYAEFDQEMPTIPREEWSDHMRALADRKRDDEVPY